MNERDISLAATEIDDPAERAQYLDQACAGQAGLRGRIEELLQTHPETSLFLHTPAGSTAVTQIMSAPTQNEGVFAKHGSGEEEFRNYLKPTDRAGWIGRLEHYEIEEILGRGAFGIVAKAFDEKLHRVVAIKLMNPEIAATSPPRKRFLREARTAAAVSHENVVAIHAVEEEPIPYLAMEYVPGQTLQERIDQHGPLEPLEISRIGQEVAAGLAAAHSNNLIHRDIKPANILLSDGPSSRAKISDFGLARAVDDASLTSSGLIAGTPMFMAPEQVRGETLDHRGDLFSLGSVLYYMTAGRPPFRAANTMAVLRRVCEDTPRALADAMPGTPVWLETIIFKLLEKDRNERFENAEALADLLARCQRELEAHGKVTCVEEYATDVDVTPYPTGTPSDDPEKTNLLGWLIGGTLALAAVIAAIVMNSETGLPDAQPGSSETTTASPSTAPSSAAAAVPTPTIESERPTAEAQPTPWQGWPADAPAPAIAPFDAVQAKEHQEVWAKYLGVPVEFENSIGMKLRLIPPCEFLMGSTPEEIETASNLPGRNRQLQDLAGIETPRHTVILTQPYYIGVTEVTQAQYEKVMGHNPSDFSTGGDREERIVVADTSNHPVEMVNWKNAMEFCEELSRTVTQAASEAGDNRANEYRLPSVAEWEHACRAGTTTSYWSGSDMSDAGWYSGNSKGHSHAAGELQPNPFGLFDVHGNVSEWTQDAGRSHDDTEAPKGSEVDPVRPVSKGDKVETRGGSWINHPSFCRSSAHYPMFRQSRTRSVGFRVVLPVNEVRESVGR